MGLFDFFKKQPVEVPHKQAAADDNGFSRALLEELSHISALSPQEVREILQLVVEGDGPNNLSRYFKEVFNKYFLGRQWTWPWYDQWDTKFASIGDYPSNWQKMGEPSRQLGTHEIVRMLKVSELQEALAAIGVAIPVKAKKSDLIDLATATEDRAKAIATGPAGSAQAAKHVVVEGYDLYSLMMRTTVYRAKAKAERVRQTQLGIRERTLVAGFKEDQRFIDLALAGNPNALAPLYPGDMSFWKPVLPF